MNRLSWFGVALALVPSLWSCRDHPPPPPLTTRAPVARPAAPPGPPLPSATELASEPLSAAFERLRPLHTVLQAPPTDGRPRVQLPGQTFKALVAANPERPSASRSAIVLQPLGELSDAQRQLMVQAADYLGRFFGLPARVAASPAPVADNLRSPNPRNRRMQLSGPLVLEQVLPAHRPADAFILLGVTGEDLFERLDGTFVFGLPDPSRHQAVWSLARYGDPSEALGRTLKDLSRAAAEAMGIHRCQAFVCVLDDGDSLPTIDARPMELCPLCSQKVSWLTGVDPAARDERLAAFMADHPFDADQKLLARELQALRAGAK